MFGRLPAHYDELGALLSFGQDPRWRRAAVAAVRAEPTDRVLDVARRTGLVSRALIRRWGCRVVGLDQSAPMLDRARAAVAADPALGARLELVEGEAERLPFADAEFDHLTFTYLLRYVDDPAATLRELARVVKPGGRVASLEFCLPRGIWLPAWRLYTRFLLPLLSAASTPPAGTPRAASSVPASRASTASGRCGARSRRGGRPGSATSGCGG